MTNAVHTVTDQYLPPSTHDRAHRIPTSVYFVVAPPRIRPGEANSLVAPDGTIEATAYASIEAAEAALADRETRIDYCLVRYSSCRCGSDVVGVWDIGSGKFISQRSGDTYTPLHLR